MCNSMLDCCPSGLVAMRKWSLAVHFWMTDWKRSYYFALEKVSKLSPIKGCRFYFLPDACSIYHCIVHTILIFLKAHSLTSFGRYSLHLSFIYVHNHHLFIYFIYLFNDRYNIHASSSSFRGCCISLIMVVNTVRN